MMHFRASDLAAERCVWSIPPIDTVRRKLRTEKLVVRSIDKEGKVLEIAPSDGLKPGDLVSQLLADRRSSLRHPSRNRQLLSRAGNAFRRTINSSRRPERLSSSAQTFSDRAAGP
jgi:hypothetical protein